MKKRKILLTQIGATEALEVMAQGLKFQRRRVASLYKRLGTAHARMFQARGAVERLEREKDALALQVIGLEKRELDLGRELHIVNRLLPDYGWIEVGGDAEAESLVDKQLCVLNGPQGFWLAVYRAQTEKRGAQFVPCLTRHFDQEPRWVLPLRNTQGGPAFDGDDI